MSHSQTTIRALTTKIQFNYLNQTDFEIKKKTHTNLIIKIKETYILYIRGESIREVKKKWYDCH